MRPRDNPFRTTRVEALRYRAPGFAWDELLVRLERQGGRGAIRGPEGSGKTTLLHELGDRLAATGCEVRRLRPDLDDRRLAVRQVRSFAANAGRKTALLLDGADRVGRLDWWSLLRASREVAALVVTTHREGRLPTLQRCLTSPELLAELMNELDPAALVAAQPEELYARAAGNVRVALRERYDAVAR